jgi:Pyruvate/2-oxoacid:ferredoxin oxidoreductase delta subunit
MSAKVTRKIIKINEAKCDGCGLCVPACVEGALQIIDGKAKLVKESYCDGLGVCLGECPQDAIIIEEREVEEFDEKAAVKHKEVQGDNIDRFPSACPSATIKQFDKQNTVPNVSTNPQSMNSMLTHWPVQLTLVPPTAGFLKGSDLILAADCVPFAYASFHTDFLGDHTLLVACPKLDDFQAHQDKLTDILRVADIKSLTVLIMEVPCCSGLLHMAKQAIAASGSKTMLKSIVIGIKGEIKSTSSS